MSARGGAVLQRLPRFRSWLWRVSYDYMASKFQLPAWIFMNYGYATLGDEPVLELRPEDERNRRPINLYRRVLGSVEVAGRDVLEVGSGRGGGASHVSSYLEPRSYVGLDYARRAVELSRRQFAEQGNLRFEHGSAEDLPFPDASFDVVLNVESSHCYPSVEIFLREVHRVLRPGGHFCIADFRALSELAVLRKQLAASGMSILEEADITANVCRSMDESSALKATIVDHLEPRIARRPMKWFAGVRGTGIYNALHDGRDAYTRWVLRKDDQPSA